eukprot:NODE_393_length_8140_cov_0.738341.p6 type:complete len:219 gc:universal NODE_393_length_8140_cov_0.738341:810-154(-)
MIKKATGSNSDMISLIYAVMMIPQSPSKFVQVGVSVSALDAESYPGQGRLCGVGMSDGIFYCQYTADGGVTWSPAHYISVYGSWACVVGFDTYARCTKNIDGTLNDQGTYDVSFTDKLGQYVDEIQFDETYMCVANSHTELWCATFGHDDWVRITPTGDGCTSIAVDAGQLCFSKSDGIYCGALSNPVDPNMELTHKYPYQLEQMSMRGNYLCGLTLG